MNWKTSTLAILLLLAGLLPVAASDLQMLGADDVDLASHGIGTAAADSNQAPLAASSGSSPVPSAIRPDAGSAQPLQGTPTAGLFDALADPAKHTTAGLLGALRAYYHDLGYDTPTDIGLFEENSTLTFTYPVGDMDHDGIDDIVMNVFCVDLDTCRYPPLGLFPPDVPPVNPTSGVDDCGLIQNHLFAVSGANGTMLWDRPMSKLPWTITDPVTYVNHTFQICPVEFVAGTVPLADGTSGVLLLSVMGTWASDLPATALPCNWFTGDINCATVAYAIIEHHLILLNPATGSPHWDYAVQGSAKWVYLWETRTQVLDADNFLVNPLIQLPRQKGARLGTENTAVTLHVQGVGFQTVILTSAVPLLGGTAPATLVLSYQPKEWAALLDADTGTEKWNAPTFQPTAETYSVLPDLLNGPPLPYAGVNSAESTRAWYWGHLPCCSDITGDSVPDLVYTTLEWNSLPTTNIEGPYYLTSRLVAFDGATGAQVWAQVTEPETPMWEFPEYEDYPDLLFWGGSRYGACVLSQTPRCFAFGATTEFVGDLTGDGAADVLVHLVYYLEDYRHVLSLRDGKTGAELWNLEKRRDQYALPLGDADGDGAGDLLVYSWFSREFPWPRTYHLANATVMQFFAHSGLDGRPLWDAQTFNAPIDLGFIFNLLKLDGLPDLNGDGVVDVPVDDPVILPDLTVVHQITWLSGRGGTPLWRHHSVGTFAFPSVMGDVTGDGIEDLSLLSGEILDLWTTVFDARTGEALWSHRLLAPALADYTLAVPYVRHQVLRDANSTQPRDLVNLQVAVLNWGGFFRSFSIYPQIATYAPDGTTQWAHPKIASLDEFAPRVLGASPATQTFDQYVAEQTAPQGWKAQVETGLEIGPQAALYTLLSTPLGFGAAWGFQRFIRWRKSR